MLQIDFKEHNRKSAEIWKAYHAGNPAKVPIAEKEINAMKHEVIGRPVRIVSLGFNNRSVEEIACVMEQEGENGVDLMILPETWTGTEMEKMDGPAVSMCAAIAKKHHAYVVCPVYREDELGKRFNTAILFDREGNPVFSYDKNYPYWSEFDLRPPCEPGQETGVYETDFGKIGIQICFDVNFPGVWDKLAAEGAELVVWPSAYSAGTSLMAHAINHHYYIVSSTLIGDCSVFDITGQEILHEKDESINISRITLDFDRCIFHENFNEEKKDRMLMEHAGDVVQEFHLEREQWFVMKANTPEISVRKLAAAYRMEELRAYVRRSAREIDRKKGKGNMASC